MIRHVILWQLKDRYADDEKARILENMKKHLEALPGVVPGLISLHIEIRPLSSSTADAMLDSYLEDEKALEGYRVHPAHVAADTYVRPCVKNRVCLDYALDD